MSLSCFSPGFDLGHFFRFRFWLLFISGCHLVSRLYNVSSLSLTLQQNKLERWSQTFFQASLTFMSNSRAYRSGATYDTLFYYKPSTHTHKFQIILKNLLQ
jgi:hypothetical protein